MIRQRGRRLGPAEEWIVAALCLSAVFLILLPFLQRQNAWREWSNYFWLVQKQAEAIEVLGNPTYFLHDSTTGVFYPQFVFYGGTLWGITGSVAVLAGSAWFAFALMLVLAACAAYGGAYWLARHVGIGSRSAHLPALVAVSSPYYVTNIYGRGAWGEVIAVSALPLVLAAAVSLVTSPRLRPLPVVALLAGTALIAGSHNITLLWGALYVAVLGALAAWVLRDKSIPWRRVGLVVLVALVGIGVNFWFLLPDLAYAADTRAYVDSAEKTDDLWPLDRARVILSPYPHVPAEIAALNSAVYMQIPLYPVLWTLAAGALLLRRGSQALRRFWLGLVGLLIALGSLLVVNQAWDVMPTVVKSIQFPFRLHIYVILTAVLLIMVALLAVQASGKRIVWLGALVAAVGLQLSFALYAAWTADEYIGRGAITKATAPPSFERYQRVMFRSVGGSAQPKPVRRLRVSPADAADGRAVLSGRLAPGARRYATNIVYSRLVSVRGDATIAGRDEDGLAVVEVRRERGVSQREWRARLEGGQPWPVRAGAAVSFACLGLALALPLVIAWRSRSQAGRTTS